MNIPILPPSCGASAVSRRRDAKLPSVPLGALFLTTLLLLTAATPLFSQSGAAEDELRLLARALRDKSDEASYARLREFAALRIGQPLGARAALALGYYDQSQGHHDGALLWFEQTGAEPLLREYTLYASAQSLRAKGLHLRAAERLETLRREFPESVLRDAATRALVESVLAVGRPSQALEELEKTPEIESKPALLLLRARALEQTSRRVEAAADFRTLYYRFPLSDEARAAGQKLPVLARELGSKLAPAPVEAQLARADVMHAARRWQESRSEFTRLIPKLSGAERERARLRGAEARVRMGAGPAVVAALSFADADVEAERLRLLVELYRSRRQPAPMRAAAEQLLKRFPESPWTESALFATGNYYWANLDRVSAAEFYRRVLDRFPESDSAGAAHWRLAWLAYLERRENAAELLDEHLRRFPGSAFTANALYWLGRATERGGNPAHARAFYVLLIQRFPQDYFTAQAGARMAALGAGPTNPAEVLLPDPPAALRLDDAIPEAAAQRRARAEALRMIALDAQAETEFRAAYAATGAPSLLLEAARAAADAGRITAAIAAARQAAPQLESRRWQDVPEEIWRLVYPLPYEAAIRQNADRHSLDPLLVAAIIRQESHFQRDAVSRAGALGVMQVMPKTGRSVARRLGLGYARARLFQPEYNLRLGTWYLAQRIAGLNQLEFALAAYNAGLSRVQAWRAERAFEEPAEFVESIPFTETREYVQVVMRNLEIYRRLYGKAQ